ncbi:MAG: YcnI family protein [Jatrophihabitantaceae bacterium]
MRTLAIGTIVLGAALVGFAGPASAHVTVNSPGATQGGYAVLTFRVPTESATASTTKLQVQFPTEAPISSVLVQPHPGWSFKTITSKLATPITTDDGDSITEAVSEIDWTADSAADAIKPGEFDQFLVSAGPLPNVSVLQFSAIQTYSDNSVVKWNEVPAPGSTVAPGHPKPSLSLAKAGVSVTATPVASSASSAPSAPSAKGSDTGAIVLSIIALVVAAAALGFGVLSRARSARP